MPSDRVWRLLRYSVHDGARNMAIDRAIQFAHGAGEAPPTLRLYGWSVPTVTLGRFQDASSVDRLACANSGVAVVRRFTGGRGVLHDDEVTYSVVAGTRDGVPRGVAASYRYLCEGLACAYSLLGVDAELTSRPRGSRSSAACYLHATHADLSVGTAKLAGSAQVWHADTVLQHGSFTRTRDPGREAEVFRLDSAQSAELAATTATLRDLLGTEPSVSEIANAVAAGVAAGLGIRLDPGELSASELELAARFEADTGVDVSA